jgi:hypothetical protein
LSIGAQMSWVGSSLRARQAPLSVVPLGVTNEQAAAAAWPAQAASAAAGGLSAVPCAGLAVGDGEGDEVVVVVCDAAMAPEFPRDGSSVLVGLLVEEDPEHATRATPRTPTAHPRLAAKIGFFMCKTSLHSLWSVDTHDRRPILGRDTGLCCGSLILRRGAP